MSLFSLGRWSELRSWMGVAVFGAACFLAVTLSVAQGPDDFAPPDASGSSGGRSWMRGFGRLRVPGVMERNHRAVKEAFREVIKQPGRSVVRVIADGSQVAYGCVVQADGLVLTKASELEGELHCQLYDGRRVSARQVAIDDAFDLALLQLELDGDLPPIEWREAVPPVGSWLAVVGLGQLPVATGVVSNEPRRIDRGSPFLGVTLEDSAKGPRIASVLDDTAAAQAGLKIDDIILTVDGQSIETREAILSSIQSRRPGDRMRFKLLRDLGNEPAKTPEDAEGAQVDENEGDINPPSPDAKPSGDAAGESSPTDVLKALQLELTATLGHRREQQLQAENLTGPLNRRRSDFAEALQHDAIVLPQDCGGPLVDLDGKVVAINIARAGRVETYALTAKTAREVVVRLKAQATQDLESYQSESNVSVEKP